MQFISKQWLTLTLCQLALLTQPITAQVCETQLPTADVLVRQLYPNNDSVYLYRIHPYAYHAVMELTGPADYAKLEDGSVWYVQPQHRHIIKSWGQDKDQQIFIKPSVSWFSSCRFVLHNRKTQQIVNVNYSAAHDPLYANSIHTITVIDSYNNMIRLEDGSVWYMNPRTPDFKNWWIGDRVIIGVNNHWRNTTYPHILINVNIESEPYCEASTGN